MSIDVSLIDFHMADKDGLELAADMRQSNPDMPIAIITANVQDEIIDRVRELGAAFIAKPLSVESLRDFIDDAAMRLAPRFR